MEEFKRGDVIVDTSIVNDQSRYLLILGEKENIFYCLDTIDLNPIYIGKAWINQYAIVDSINIDKVIGFFKGELKYGKNSSNNSRRR